MGFCLYPPVLSRRCFLLCVTWLAPVHAGHPILESVQFIASKPIGPRAPALRSFGVGVAAVFFVLGPRVVPKRGVGGMVRKFRSCGDAQLVLCRPRINDGLAAVAVTWLPFVPSIF